MTTDNNTRLKDLMCDILLIDPEQYKDDTTTDDVEAWDSLGMTSLIVGLETEFGVKIASDDGLNLMSIEAIKTFLRSQGIEI